ncbi:MAG: XRE family transcriptional regulator [Verrucomicrobiaceae bacterium]|nr:MAG: XRE family transcriptional regulator [Verrucomicrobiaceae bacterium]
MSQDLRAKLKAARRKLEITQTEASKAWGVPLGTLICWENNKRHPTPFTRSMLDMMLDEILEEHSVPPQPEESDGKQVKATREIRPNPSRGRRTMESDDSDSDSGLPG